MEVTQKTRSNAIIQLEKISVFQHHVLIVTDVSLFIGRGEFVYLIGPTGSGKSSLLKLMYADLPAVDGFAQVAGYDLRKIKQKQVPFLRRKIGIVFQDFQLLTDRTVNENLLFVMRATGWNNKIDIKQRSIEVLDMVGLSDKGNKMPNQLSGGEQQRVALARAFINNPKILFCDEPTGNLDSENATAMIDLIFGLNLEKQTTLVLVTHDSDLAKRCKRILRFRSGKIISDSNHLA